LKLEEFKSLTNSILANLSDQAKVSEILMNLNDDYTQQLAQAEQMTAKITEAETNIKSLKDTNMNLFLKLANPIPEKAVEKPATEEITYDDLLKEWSV
jgi:hypothetical protein